MEPTWTLTGSRGGVTVTVRIYVPITDAILLREQDVLKRRLEQLS